MSELDAELLQAGSKNAFWQGRWGKAAIAAIGLAVLAAAYLIYQQVTPKESEYLTMPVTQGRIVDSIQATGTVNPLREADLFYKTKDILKKLNAKEGDLVQKGDVLAVQNDTDYRVALDQAQNNLKSAELKLKQSQLDLEKVKETLAQQETLYKADLVAETALNQARRDYQNAQLSLEANKIGIANARANVETAKNNLENTIMTAPFTGVVATVNGEEGLSTEDTGSLIHLISSDLQIECSINEADVGRVKAGQSVSITVASYPNRPFRGKVDRVGTQALSTNNIQQFSAVISFEDPRHLLLAGMSATANIIVAQTDESILVPSLAINYGRTYARDNAAVSGNSGGSQGTASTGSSQNRRMRSGQNSGTSGQNSRQRIANGGGFAGTGDTAGFSFGNRAAFGENLRSRVVILKNGKPVLTEIETGLSDGTNTQVLKGLKAGDLVIIGKNSTEASGNSSSGQNVQNSQNGQSGQTRSNRNFDGPMPGMH